MGLLQEHQLAGIIATKRTLEGERLGLKTGVERIFTAADVWEKIAAGVCLVQVYTGWIYGGTWMLKALMQGLGQKLEDYGFK